MLWANWYLAGQTDIYLDIGVPGTAAVYHAISSVLARMAIGLQALAFLMLLHVGLGLRMEWRAGVPSEPIVNLSEATDAVARLQAEARHSANLLQDRQDELARIQELISLTEPQLAALEQRFWTKKAAVATIIGLVVSAVGLTYAILSDLSP